MKTINPIAGFMNVIRTTLSDWANARSTFQGFNPPSCMGSFGSQQKPCPVKVSLNRQHPHQRLRQR